MTKAKQKLELTWIGKENRPKLEPRILLEDPAKSYHAQHRVTDNDIFDNKLIFGDNLLALKALEQEFAGGEGRNTVGAWPGAGGPDQTLFCAVGQNITKASMRSSLVSDDDRAVTARPKSLAPDMEMPGLLGDVSIYELHEEGELPSAAG